MMHEIIGDVDSSAKLANDENGYCVSMASAQALGDDAHTVQMISQFQTCHWRETTQICQLAIHH